MFSCAAAAADNRDLVEEIFHELRAFPLQFHNTQGEVKSRDYQGRVVYARRGLSSSALELSRFY